MNEVAICVREAVAILSLGRPLQGAHVVRDAAARAGQSRRRPQRAHLTGNALAAQRLCSKVPAPPPPSRAARLPGCRAGPRVRGREHRGPPSVPVGLSQWTDGTGRPRRECGREAAGRAAAGRGAVFGF